MPSSVALTKIPVCHEGASGASSSGGSSSESDALAGPILREAAVREKTASQWPNPSAAVDCGSPPMPTSSRLTVARTCTRVPEPSAPSPAPSCQPMARNKVLASMLAVFLVACVSAFTLRVQYPRANLPSGATEMYVRGSGLGLSWDRGVKMQSNGGDEWSVVLSGTGAVQLKVLADDQAWQLGANEMFSVGGAGGEATVYPFFVPTGGQYSVVAKPLCSQPLGNCRQLAVYVPPGYDENGYMPIENVIVAQDGQNLFNDSTSFLGISWDIEGTVGRLVLEGRMRGVAVLGLYNTPDRMDDYTYSYDKSVGAGGKADLYLDFVEKVVLPFVAREFPRFRLARENLAILGSSLGGLLSCYAGWTRSHVYSRALCMSSSFWWNSQDFLHTVLPTDGPAVSSEIFYLDSGTAGPGKDDEVETIAVRKALEARGWAINETVFYYLDFGGQHNEYFWRQRFHVPMTDLYHPTSITV